MSAQFSKGDRVEVIASADEGIGAGFPVGATGTVHSLHLFPNDGLVFVCIDGDCEMYAWFMPANLRKVEPEDKDDLYVEPEPLKEGDWVQVWAKYVREDNLGAVVVATPTGVGGDGCRNTYASPDAIVRPDAGQVPPWVKTIEEPTADYAIIRDGFRTLVRLPEDQRGVDEGSRPWVVVGSNIVCAWDDIEEPVIVSGGAA